METKNESVVKLANNNTDENDNSDDTYIIVVGQNDTDENDVQKAVTDRNVNYSTTEFSKILSPSDNAVICRVCMSENITENLVPINGEKLRFVNVTIQSALNSLVSINMSEDDDFPKNICSYCLSKLESAWAFQQQCFKSNRIMNELRLATKQFCELSNSASHFIFPEVIINSDTDLVVDESYEDDYNNDVLENMTEYFGKKKFIKENSKNVKLQKRKIQTRWPHRGRPPKKPRLNIEDLKCGISPSTSEDKQSMCCDMCGKAATTVEEIIEHKISEHGSSYPYSCTICKRFFKTEGSLLQHVKTLHSVNVDYTRRIKCNICQKKVNRNIVSDHYLSHKKQAKSQC